MMRKAAILFVLLMIALVPTPSLSEAGCRVRFTEEVERFRSELLDMVRDEPKTCNSYPIRLFPCLFCECQNHDEGAKTTGSSDAGKPYECRWQGMILGDEFALNVPQLNSRQVRQRALRDSGTRQNSDRSNRGNQRIPFIRRPQDGIVRDPRNGALKLMLVRNLAVTEDGKSIKLLPPL